MTYSYSQITIEMLITFLLTDFKLNRRIWNRGSRKMQLIRGTPYMCDMRFYRAHTRAHTYTHTLFARVYTRSGYSSVRPLRASVYESSCVYVYAQIGVSRRHGRCVTRDARSMCICTTINCVWVCMCVRATRRRVHRRHRVAGGECSIFTLCLIAGYGVDYINLIPTRARRCALDSKRERFRAGKGRFISLPPPPRLT